MNIGGIFCNLAEAFDSVRNHGIKYKRRILDKILYVGNSDIPLYLLVSFITLIINRYNNEFLPLLWQFSLIPNIISKFVDPIT
jgi:hypothetical protein